MIKEGKQAEFLLFNDFPWHLVERIGVIDRNSAEQVTAIVKGVEYQPAVNTQLDWYY